MKTDFCDGSRGKPFVGPRASGRDAALFFASVIARVVLDDL